MSAASQFERALEGRVRRKRNITGNIRYESMREKAQRMCRNSPEVMVRITSYGKGAGNARANLGYISRIDARGKENLDLETDRGEILSGEASIKEYAKSWEDDFGKPSKHRRDTMRMVLSMPEGTDPEAVKNATRDFARITFSANHEYAFVLHTDEPHPHCHLIVKMLGHDGTRLDPRKNDLADWREIFAQALRDHGVDAEATRRAARGVVLKAENTAVHHMAADGRVSKALVRNELDAIAALKAEQQGAPAPPGPWVPRIEAEQMAVRSAWLAVAEQLARPPVKPTFKEIEHGRQHLTDSAARRAALYQPTLAAPRPGELPRPVTNLGSLRKLPDLDVVRHRATQVLLQADARDRMGRGAGTGDGLRWAGTGSDGGSGGKGREGAEACRPQRGMEGGCEGNSIEQGAAAREGASGAIRTAAGLGAIPGLVKLSDIQTTQASDRELAGEIKAFVGRMPAVETAHDLLKRRLAAQFTLQPMIVQNPAQSRVQEKGAEQAAPDGPNLMP